MATSVFSHQLGHVCHVLYQLHILLGAGNEPPQLGQMRIATADNHGCIEARLSQNRSHNAPGDVVRIAAPHGHQNPPSHRWNLPVPPAPRGKFAPQHRKTRTQQQLGGCVSMWIEILTGVRVLIQQEIRRVVSGVAVIINEQHFEAAAFQTRLVLCAKFVAVDHHPRRAMLVRQLGGFLRIGHAPHPNRRSRNLEPLVSQPFFHRGRGVGHRENSVPSRIPPGLRQRQTAHHMPRSYGETAIGPNQKDAPFHLLSSVSGLRSLLIHSAVKGCGAMRNKIWLAPYFLRKRNIESTLSFSK